MKSPLTLAVVSGKGGVGKSVTAANLAETFAAHGRRVALLDADAGQSAVPILFNAVPPATVADVARGEATVEAVPLGTDGGVTIVQAARGAAEAEAEGPAFVAALDTVLAHLAVTHDVVLVDTPAGTGPLVRWALDRADAGLLVLVGEPTAVADAYALVKLVWSAAPDYRFGAVVNFADTEAEAESVAARFGAVTQPFLGDAPAYLGWIPYAVSVRQSVREQTPAVRRPGAARQAFAALAEAAVADPVLWSACPTAPPLP